MDREDKLTNKEMLVNIGEVHTLWPIILKDDPELAEELEQIVGSDMSKEYYAGIQKGIGFIIEYVERNFEMELLDERKITALMSCVGNRMITPAKEVPGYR